MSSKLEMKVSKGFSYIEMPELANLYGLEQYMLIYEHGRQPDRLFLYASNNLIDGRKLMPIDIVNENFPDGYIISPYNFDGKWNKMESIVRGMSIEEGRDTYGKTMIDPADPEYLAFERLYQRAKNVTRRPLYGGILGVGMLAANQLLTGILNYTTKVYSACIDDQQLISEKMKDISEQMIETTDISIFDYLSNQFHSHEMALDAVKMRCNSISDTLDKLNAYDTLSLILIGGFFIMSVASLSLFMYNDYKMYNMKNHLI